MKNIKLFTRNVFHFYRRDFLILIGMNIVLGLAFRLVPVHEFIQGILICFLFFKCFTFLRSASIMPSVSSDFDRFSWKYFQGLPLSKKELILSLIITNFLIMIPFLVWVVSFSTQIGNFFTDESEIVALETKMKLLVASLPILIMIGFSSFQNLITLPRSQYSKVDAKIVFYQKIKFFLLYVFLCFYGMYFVLLLQEVSGIHLNKYLGNVMAEVFKVATSWWIIPILILMTIRSFYKTLKVWQNEHIGYIKQDWKTSRDLSIIASSFIMIMGLFYHLDFSTPNYYRGNDLVKSIFTKDITKVEKLLKQGWDVNRPNKFGFTPIMVAAHTGNDRLFKLLLAKNATLEGKVKNLKNKHPEGMNIFLLAIEGNNLEIVNYLLQHGFNPNEELKKDKNTALHIAAKKCHTKMIDQLLLKKAQVNHLNVRGETPLHLAAKKGCFGTVVALLDAGVNPLIKDQKGKLAIDYLNSRAYQQDLAYYLEKKSRKPASR